ACTNSPACLEWNNYPKILSRLLQPGTYEIEACGPANVTFAPPPPAATNVTCNGAATLTYGQPYPQPQVLDSAERWYQFTKNSQNYTYLIKVGTPHTSGTISVDIRTGCAASTTVAQASLPYMLPYSSIGPLADVTALPDGTYFIVVTKVSFGAAYSITVGPT
ncbi:MAG: hypothetical protein KDB14_33690, partial [Planctomycetales bacterium]|nr:hypothetical protein [Planctomycetales bacterium]